MGWVGKIALRVSGDSQIKTGDKQTEEESSTMRQIDLRLEEGRKRTREGGRRGEGGAGGGG